MSYKAIMAPANSRMPTDTYNLHPWTLKEINEEIERLCMGNHYITITNDELTMRRVLESDNSEPMGNIMALLLKEKCEELVDDLLTCQDGEDYTEDADEEGQVTRSWDSKEKKFVEPKKKGLNIFEALYDSSDGISYYFIK